MPLAQKEGRVAQKKVTFLGTQELAAEEFIKQNHNFL